MRREQRKNDGLALIPPLKGTSFPASRDKYLRSIYGKFQAFGKRVSGVVNYVFLSIVYAFGVGATSIIAKISGKSFLVLRPRDQESYWREHEQRPATLEELRRMF
jgi:hypothetical protein